MPLCILPSLRLTLFRIALLRDETRMLVLGRHSAGKPKIGIYSSSGIHLASLTVCQGIILRPDSDEFSSCQWDLSAPVMMGWTPDEQLVVMADDGTYRIYDLSSALAGLNTSHPESVKHAGDYHQYSLGGEIADVGVIEGEVHEHGFVVLTGNLAFVHVKGFTGGRPTTLTTSGMLVITLPGRPYAYRPSRNECPASCVDGNLA